MFVLNISQRLFCILSMVVLVHVRVWRISIKRLCFTGAQTDFIRLQDEVSTKAAKEEKAMAAEVKAQKEIIFELRQLLGRTQVDLNAKEKELKSVTTNFRALEKQAEGFQDEYMRVIDESENLRNQLSFFDRKYAGSGSKKNS